MSVTKINMKSQDLPPQLRDGEKFIKWDEDNSAYGTPVTLKLDKYGFYLQWIDQNCESDVLDLAFLRDTRTGKQARIPKSPALRQVVNIGSTDSLEEKTITLVFGSDFVNLTFVNFCCAKKELAKLWSDELLKLIRNRVQANASALTYLLKAHTKLTLLLDRNGKIPVKNVAKMFSQNKDERKRVERALDASGLPCGKNDAISLSAFEFEEFFTFYKHLTKRVEVEKAFEESCSNKKKYMTSSQLVEFMNKIQRDPRLNEILHPYANDTRARDLINEYEPNAHHAQKGHLSLDGFLRFLMSADNAIMTNSKYELYDDMDQPLAHYFINSSHNTYLTGHQLTGKSSVEMYRQCLLAGCRCVELDFWNGRTDEPVIVHGYTFVPEISAREVLEAIAESAFKTSDYPVILSFENHCNPRQQAKIAQYCRDYFGDMLLDTPMDTHKLEPGVHLPPPSTLKNKIIIKNKKKHYHHHHSKKCPTPEPTAKKDLANVGTAAESSVELASSPDSEEQADSSQPPLLHQDSKDSCQDNEEDEDGTSSGDEEYEEGMSGSGTDILKLQPAAVVDKVSSRKETEAGAEISALVNYVQPVHFTSFENAEKRNRYYEMSSFDEKQATTLLKEHPIEFVNYNKHQLSRVYPAGTRFDSSNFMPQVFWNAGCQLVAINYQTLDVAMQLNLGIFEYNQRCGYLLKPEYLRRRDRRFDPFAESTVDGIIAGTVSIHVLSGQFLTDKRVGTYVEVDMYGLPADTIRKRFRTKIVPNNGINPIYDEEPFVFKKVVLPDLACIRIAAYEESGKLIGHRVLPVKGLCPGYRHAGLQNESGQCLPLATLFLHIVVKDYVPDGLSDFAEALANPIKFQSELDRRAKQLAVLLDDTEKLQAEEADIANVGSDVKVSSPIGAFDSFSLPATASSSVLSPTPSYDKAKVAFSHLSSDTSAELDSFDLGKGEKDDLRQMSLGEASKKTQKCDVIPPSLPSLKDEIVAESLDKLAECKAVKEKKCELEKKLDNLHRKMKKEKSRAQVLKSPESEKGRPKFLGNMLTKRLSMSKNNMPNLATQMAQEYSDHLDSESDPVIGPRQLSKSTSQRLISINREYIAREYELKQTYHHIIFNTLEKAMVASQSNQMKTLRVLLEKETDAVMRKLEAKRREEVKARTKIHKNKDELVRVKREVASWVVEKGVSERIRLTEIYEKRKEELERQHNEIKETLQDDKIKHLNSIRTEYEKKMKTYCGDDYLTVVETKEAASV